MPRKLLLALLPLGLLAGMACYQAWNADVDSELEAAIEAAMDAYGEAETPEEKVKIALDFLEQFPDTEHTDRVLEVAVRHMTTDLDDAPGALELIRTTLAGVEDPQHAFEIRKVELSYYGNGKMVDELRLLAAELGRDHELKYTDHLRVIEAGLEAEAWDLVVDHAEASLEFATADQYKADYPEMTEEEAQRNGPRRIGYSQAHRGWALAKLGRDEEAVAAFNEAAGHTPFSYLGVPETPVHSYWGRHLVDRGTDLDRAIELLAADAIMGGDEDAMSAMRQAYSAKNGGEDGLEEFLWQQRMALAKVLPDFSLPDYQDRTVSLADFKGDVLMLAFWFPT